jgi:hypothetical protein
VIGYSAPTLWGIGGALSLFFILRRGLRVMAAADPILIGVHHASQRYRQGFWTSKPRKAYGWLNR